ncbi:CDP-alcohol phosphatidyltransferase family protein [Pseudonocardia sp. KRD-184]|uniref:CDP-alcohol phosphatidyltransferase family protein n=1 Tax=Pseudonocardia oceani TaxID=2792013 RepID=A0ABS6U618_9PSEU|nr:CDP-alcohol phosphatidyltransferase family protein [Pseudonocardia oceani]MBW0089015.1 CDP-alcohol phosphatidyltransferase family protein [Pseudonocardia oceani]MBW0094888.1 CDP-alcohol phosphatidyltransferase family protein [Pseudonocardia oceani]MBW0108685.1 CDP-alcohol phosphatidyltransferase family protein [Pseudonocardia oceani]MBW0120793.1 CDP-alcohol phosphatidyltransferase family protein [Pseudonocardia oceani]MBW0127674.1 CDP-alcohol phosphatidyltransferase family protein [Pseudono
MTTVTRQTTQQACAAVFQVVLLAALTATVGLGPLGWAAGTVFAAGLWVLLDGAARRAGTDALGPADLVTLARAALAGGVAALVVDGSGPVPIVVLTSVALVLDAVDGKVARRTGTASALGARFDMEVDAVLLLVLSAHVATLLGPWVLVIGLMRYAFVAAARVLPWLRGSLPVRWSAKAVAALQGIVLVAAVAGAPGWLVGLALALLVWSFGQSVLWLWRSR